MFDNNSNTLKIIAIVNFIVSMALSIIAAMWLVVENKDLLLYSIFILLFGVLYSFVISVLLAGFGELINYSKRIVEILEEKNETSNSKSISQQPRIEVATYHRNDENAAGDSQYVRIACMKCGHETKNIPCDFCGMTGHIGGNFFYI